MILTVLTPSLDTIAVVDTASSIIWADRYNEVGDFELKLPATNPNIEYLIPDNYLVHPLSLHTMVIESVNPDNDVELGEIITIKGRSLESILDRRVVWVPQHLTGSVQSVIRILLEDNVIDPDDALRTIENFIMVDSTDPVVLAASVEQKYDTGFLLDIIQDLCQVNDLGFSLTLSPDDEFIFSLYAGKDRSYEQIAYPFVVFSPDFENILRSSVYTSKALLKNVTLVDTDDANPSLQRVALWKTEAEPGDISRREQWTDARDVNRYMPVGDDLTDTEFLNIIIQRGIEDIIDRKSVSIFDGEMDTQRTFVFGEDFFMGDIVQVDSGKGYVARSRVTEIIFSEDEGGVSAYPSFVTILDE